MSVCARDLPLSLVANSKKTTRQRKFTAGRGFISAPWRLSWCRRDRSGRSVQQHWRHAGHTPQYATDCRYVLVNPLRSSRSSSPSLRHLWYLAPGEARSFGIRRDNLAGVGVISGDYDQRIAILFSEFQRPLYGFIEIDRLANLPTRIRSVILFID